MARTEDGDAVDGRCGAGLNLVGHVRFAGCMAIVCRWRCCTQALRGSGSCRSSSNWATGGWN